MMKAWILDPLPFPRPDSLIDLRSLDTVTGSVRSLNPADFLDLTRRSVVRGPRGVPQRSNRPHRRRSGGACARGASDAEPLPTAGDTRGNRPRPWTGRWRVHEHSRGRPRTRVLARALQRRSGDGEPHRPHGRRGLTWSSARPHAGRCGKEADRRTSSVLGDCGRTPSGWCKSQSVMVAPRRFV